MSQCPHSDVFNFFPFHWQYSKSSSFLTSPFAKFPSSWHKTCKFYICTPLDLENTKVCQHNMVVLIDRVMECDPVVDRSPSWKRKIKVASCHYFKFRRSCKKPMTIATIFEPKPSVLARPNQLQSLSLEGSDCLHH